VTIGWAILIVGVLYLMTVNRGLRIAVFALLAVAAVVVGRALLQ
jgi:hypothetical protein